MYLTYRLTKFPANSPSSMDIDNNNDEEPYLCGCSFDDNNGRAHVYDCNIRLGPDTFTKAELLSIHLNHLMMQHKIVRNAYRDIVRFVNTVIRDHDEITLGKHILYRSHRLYLWLT